jgi:hypothetical protein
MQVRKGEKGIEIFAPRLATLNPEKVIAALSKNSDKPYVVGNIEILKDAATGLFSVAKRYAKGSAIIEADKLTLSTLKVYLNEHLKGEQLVGFQVVNVFGDNQVTPIMIKNDKGEEVPCEKAQKYLDNQKFLDDAMTCNDNNPERAAEIYNALKKVIESDVTVEETEKLQAGRDGYCQYDPIQPKIAIRQSLHNTRKASVLVHEVAHYTVHNPYSEAAKKEKTMPDRSEKEVQADSIAYVVCKHFGIDTDVCSFQYVALWASRNKDPEILLKSMSVIQKYALDLIEKNRCATREYSKRRNYYS